MTPEEVSAIEATILDVCRATISTLRRKLAERGLECEPLELAVCNAEPDRYCSEARAMILRDGQIVDVLEFFIFEDGHAAITSEAAERYTRGVLRDALHR